MIDPTSSPDTQSIHQAGGRATRSRLAVLAAIRRIGVPVNVQDLVNEIRRVNGECDTVTVYRNVEFLEKAGLLRRHFSHTGSIMFTECREKPAYFVIPADVGPIQRLEDDFNTALAAAAARVEETLKRAGYSDVSHVIQLFARQPNSMKKGDTAAAEGQVATQRYESLTEILGALKETFRSRAAQRVFAHPAFIALEQKAIAEMEAKDSPSPEPAKTTKARSTSYSAKRRREDPLHQAIERLCERSVEEAD